MIATYSDSDPFSKRTEGITPFRVIHSSMIEKSNGSAYFMSSHDIFILLPLCSYQKFALLTHQRLNTEYSFKKLK